jgi:hypothetical protein
MVASLLPTPINWYGILVRHTSSWPSASFKLVTTRLGFCVSLGPVYNIGICTPTAYMGPTWRMSLPHHDYRHAVRSLGAAYATRHWSTSGPPTWRLGTAYLRPDNPTVDYCPKMGSPIYLKRRKALRGRVHTVKVVVAPARRALAERGVIAPQRRRPGRRSDARRRRRPSVANSKRHPKN